MKVMYWIPKEQDLNKLSLVSITIVDYTIFVYLNDLDDLIFLWESWLL